jgi:hypothetical protein
MKKDDIKTEEILSKYFYSEKIQSLISTIDLSLEDFTVFGRWRNIENPSPYRSSIVYPVLLLLSKNDLKKQEGDSEERIEFLKLANFLVYLGQTISKRLNSLGDKLETATYGKSKIKLTALIDLSKLQSAFFDYHFIKSVHKKIDNPNLVLLKKALSLNSEIMQTAYAYSQIADLSEDSMKNLWIDMIDEEGNVSKMKLHSFIRNKALSPRAIIDAISDMFGRKIEKEDLQWFAKQFVNVNIGNWADAVFRKLDTAYHENVQLSKRRKQLLLAQLFRFYNYDRLGNDNRDVDNASLQRYRVRVIQTVIPHLK